MRRHVDAFAGPRRAAGEEFEPDRLTPLPVQHEELTVGAGVSVVMQDRAQGERVLEPRVSPVDRRKFEEHPVRGPRRLIETVVQFGKPAVIDRVALKHRPRHVVQVVGDRVVLAVAEDIDRCRADQVFGGGQRKCAAGLLPQMFEHEAVALGPRQSEGIGRDALDRLGHAFLE